MNFLINYWYIIVAGIASICCLAIVVYQLIKMPTDEQLKKVREWLLFAVTEAEIRLGSGTGQLKLRSVYDLFIQRFTWISKIITFETFSNLVDDALCEMREMLEKNSAVKTLVDGGAVK